MSRFHPSAENEGHCLCHAGCGFLDTVTQLIKLGADVNARDLTQCTPLQNAAHGTYSALATMPLNGSQGGASSVQNHYLYLPWAGFAHVHCLRSFDALLPIPGTLLPITLRMHTAIALLACAHCCLISPFKCTLLPIFLHMHTATNLLAHAHFWQSSCLSGCIQRQGAAPAWLGINFPCYAYALMPLRFA